MSLIVQLPASIVRRIARRDCASYQSFFLHVFNVIMLFRLGQGLKWVIKCIKLAEFQRDLCVTLQDLVHYDVNNLKINYFPTSFSASAHRWFFYATKIISVAFLRWQTFLFITLQWFIAQTTQTSGNMLQKKYTKIHFAPLLRYFQS